MNDLTQHLIDDDDYDGRGRSVTLETIEEEEEEDSSDVEAWDVPEPLSAKSDDLEWDSSPGASGSGGKATVVATAFQLANCTLTAGTLAFPYIFAQTGIAFGILMLLYLSVISGVAQHQIIVASAVTGARSYQDVVRQVLGKGWGAVQGVVIMVYQFGACVALLYAIADMGIGMICSFGKSTFGSLCEPPMTMLRAAMMAIICIFICFPLSILERVSTLSPVSMLGVTAAMVMTIVILALGVIDLLDRGTEAVFCRLRWMPEQGVAGFTNVVKAIPVMMFALQSHVATPALYAELRPQTKNKRNMSKAMLFAYVLMVGCYTVTGVFGYTQLGNSVAQDVLETDNPLRRSQGHTFDNAVTVARALVLVGSLCSFPINHFLARSALFSLATKGPQDSPPRWAYNVEGGVFITVAYVCFRGVRVHVAARGAVTVLCVVVSVAGRNRVWVLYGAVFCVCVCLPLHFCIIVVVVVRMQHSGTG